MKRLTLKGLSYREFFIQGVKSIQKLDSQWLSNFHRSVTTEFEVCPNTKNLPNICAYLQKNLQGDLRSRSIFIAIYSEGTDHRFSTEIIIWCAMACKLYKRYETQIYLSCSNDIHHKSVSQLIRGPPLAHDVPQLVQFHILTISTISIEKYQECQIIMNEQGDTK